MTTATHTLSKAGECDTCHNWFNSKYGGIRNETTSICAGCHTTAMLLEGLKVQPKSKLHTEGLDFTEVCPKCGGELEITETYNKEKGWVFISEHLRTKSSYCAVA